HPIPQRDLRELARAEESRPGQDRRAQRGACLPPPDCHHRRRRGAVLAGRGLPPALLREERRLLPCLLCGRGSAMKFTRGLAGALVVMAVGMVSNTAFGELGRGDRYSGAQWATRSPALGQHGMAATAVPAATEVALDILKKGGSAVDAAIA